MAGRKCEYKYDGAIIEEMLNDRKSWHDIAKVFRIKSNEGWKTPDPTTVSAWAYRNYDFEVKLTPKRKEL